MAVDDGKKITIKLKTRYPQIEFDKLQMYFGIPYVIDVEDARGCITIAPPTLGRIVEYGEKKFYESLNIFITNTTSYRLVLWTAGIDWNDISDFDLFCMLYKQIDHGASSLIFGDLDFSKFELFQKHCDDGDKVVLYSEESDIEINEAVYQHMAQYLRAVFNMYPEEKMTESQALKEMYIRKDKAAIENEAKRKKKKNEEKSNSIQPLISACINHPGFKYKLSELKEVGICEFYDSVKRLQIYENTTALLRGMYSGMMDASKIDPDSYNFMKEI